MQKNTDAEEQSFHNAPAAALSDPPDYARLLSLEPSSNQTNAGPHLPSLSLRYWSSVSIALGPVLQEQSDIFPGVNGVLQDIIASSEDEELKEWKKRYPGTALDRDQLLRKVNHEAKQSGQGLAPYQEQFQVPSLAQQSEPVGSKTLCDASRSWAVIIGIDAYERLDCLKGCVNDAILVHEFLTDSLKIPDDRITTLTTDQDRSPDSQWPTRDNIIHALYNLRDNSNIKFNDDIIIYFSGHGTRYQTSALSELGQQVDPIDALCPVDHGPVPGISDRELSRLIQEIRTAKGRNIVVILDACHSGGMARGSDTPNTYLAARSVDYPWEGRDLERMLRAADQHPRRKSTTNVFSPMWTSDSPPCIFMAACRSGERAWERRLGPHNRIHGVFTHTLVKALKMSVRAGRTTYAHLEANFAVLLSHPQAPTGLQHAYFAGDQSRRLWYQVYGWVQGSVTMALVNLLLTVLGDSLCRTHQPYPNVGYCNDCMGTHRAFKALYAQVKFSIGTHPELGAIREELDALRQAAKMDNPVMEQSSMPDLNPPSGNVLRGFLSLPAYVTSVPKLKFPQSQFHELRNSYKLKPMKRSEAGVKLY
ncbi:hypothetical protein EWM64_g7613 [Hericium alpestre]|uniref:Peptidase C14 caspase domain-containing protein n=1 Tax=Hericium alpestre TaxID=135208 RepID=A0A4Y9ZSC8_9AGAM|nr:hypothetical protein EWM64_g7613 [Hericium alpestre]